MKRRIGPILHWRPGPLEEWRFSVGLWLQPTDDVEPTISFLPAGHASVSPLRTAGSFAGGVFRYWEVTVRKQAEDLTLSYTIDGLDGKPISVDNLVIPALGTSPRISYFSCNGVQDPKKWTSQPEMELLWKRMRERHEAGVSLDKSGGPYHLLIGGGDQLYCDSVWLDVPQLGKLKSWAKREAAQTSATLEAAIEKHYAWLYESRWKDSWFQDIHARVPGVYIWDDHDIYDGWGSYGNEDKPVMKAIFECARRAFELLQLGGGSAAGAPCLDPSPTSPFIRYESHYLQAARISAELDLLVLDLRTQRTRKQVMGNSQWQVLSDYLAQRATAPGTHLLVVSTIPVVYLNFAAAEAALGWIPWRQELEDDLRDHWESPDHQEERSRLIMALLKHASETKTRITLLSGDVHVGARGKITSRRAAHLLPGESESVIHQLTSSAIVFPPPKGFELLGMRAISKEGPSALLSFSQVETEVVKVSAEHFLLGEKNWLSIEPEPARDGEREKLWVRWLTKDGDVKPPLLIHGRSSE